MKESSPIGNIIRLSDVEAGDRFSYIVSQGRIFFRDTTLTVPNGKIYPKDTDKILPFYNAVSPEAVSLPWRVEPRIDVSNFPKDEQPYETLLQTAQLKQSSQIVDTSFYQGWSDPGGAFEHIRMVPDGAAITLSFLKHNLRNLAQVQNPQVQEAIESIALMDPELVKAAGWFHDIGRLVTHGFSNGPMGRRLLQRMEIRSDIINAIPDEETYFQVRLTPQEERWMQTNNVNPDEILEIKHLQNLMNLDPVQVVLGIADNLSKRYPGTNRIFVPEDFTSEKMQRWADGYTTRPHSGRPYEEHIGKGLQRHVANEGFVFKAFDSWIQLVSHTNLHHLSNQLRATFEPQLVHLNKKMN